MILFLIFQVFAQNPVFDTIRMRGSTQHQVPFYDGSEYLASGTDLTFNDTTDKLYCSGPIEGAEGVIMGNLDTTARDALSAATGTVIYNTDDSEFQFYTGAAWASLDTLRGLSCSSTQVAAWNGSAWACANASSGAFTYDASDNVYLADETPASLSGALDNVVISSNSASLGLTSGDDNICIGNNACSSVTVESGSVMIGQDAGANGFPSATAIVAIGDNACKGINTYTGSGHTCVGDFAGAGFRGNDNTALGTSAGQAVTNSGSSDNTFVGAYAGFNMEGSRNIGIGAYVGYTGGTMNDTFLLDANSDCWRSGGSGTRCFLQGDMSAGDLVVENSVAAANSGSLRMQELDSNGTHYLAFSAPDSVTANVTWELPDGDGAANSTLKTDGSGNLDWVEVVGGRSYSDFRSHIAFVDESGNDVTTIQANFTETSIIATCMGNILTVYGLIDSGSGTNGSTDWLEVSLSTHTLVTTYFVDSEDINGFYNHSTDTSTTDLDRMEYNSTSGRVRFDHLIGNFDGSDTIKFWFEVPVSSCTP